MQVMNLVLLSAKRAMGCPECDLRVGKPHGAESGFDPYSAFKDVDDSNFFQYICGEILGPEEPSEWVCAAPQACSVCPAYKAATRRQQL